MSLRALALVSVAICASLFAQVPDEPNSDSTTPEPAQTAVKVAPISSDVTSTGPNGELWLDPPPSPFTTGLLLKAFTATPNIFTQLGTSDATSTFSVRDSAGTSAFRVGADGSAVFGKSIPSPLWIYPNGRVAITAYNDTPPAARFLLQGGLDNLPALFSSNQTGVETTAAQNDINLFLQSHTNVHAGATSNSVQAIYANAWLTGQGTLAQALGAYIDVGTYQYSGYPEPGTINDATGLRILFRRAGNSTITSGKAIYIQDVLANNDWAIYQESATDENYFAGKVGIGTNQPLDPLHLSAAQNNGIRMTHTDPASAMNAITFYENGTLYGFINQRGSTFAGQARQFNIGNNNALGDTSLWAGGLGRMVVYANGNVGIGTTSAPAEKLRVSGDLYVTGMITGGTVIGAVYQDLAEWVPATTDMEPGTVVVLNHDRTNEVMPSHQPYDTSVAGVVSAQPGVILGIGGESKEQIATTGRVKVRVDARRAAIRVGDLLVTSDVAGTAMRSEAMEINGRRFHQPGTIIGKALEPLESGVGEILVLLSLQ